MRQVPLDIVAGSYSDETRPFSSQDTVNYLPVFAEQGGTRTPTMLKTPPGLRPFVQVLDTSEDIARPIGPVRRTHNCEGKLFAVMGQTLYQVTPSGVAIPQGTIPGVGRCSMAHNQLATGNQLVTVNGTSGYCFNTQTQVFERITDEGFPGAIKVIFMDGYIIGIEPRRRFAFNSEVADALAYNTLDRFTSEYLPDLLVSLESVQNQLVLFSEGSMEFFENTGATEQPFRSKRISQKRGCAGTFTTAVIDQTVYWLGDDGIFYRLEGYAPKRISTRPIEQAIRGLDWKNAFAETWTDAGHLVVYWTFPDGLTWGYDISSGQWHRRQSYGFNRWRPSTLTYINSEWVAGDFQNGRLWKLDWDYVLEGDEEIISERVTQTLADNQNRMLVNRLELIVDTGQEITEPTTFPAQPDPPSMSGSAPDGTVGEAYSFTYTLTPGGSPILRTQIVSGELLPGLTWNQSTATLSGTPTRAGTMSLSFRVTDQNGLYALHSDTISISIEVEQLQVLEPGRVTSAAWSPDDSYLAFGSYISPYLVIHKRTGDTFAQLGTVTTPLTDRPHGLAWDDTGTYLAVAPENAVPAFILKRTGDTFAWLTDLPSQPPNQERGLAWRGDGDQIAMVNSGLVSPPDDPRLGVWSWNAGTETPSHLFNQALSAFPESPNGCSYSDDGSLLAVGLEASPYLSVLSVESGSYPPYGTLDEAPPHPAKAPRFSPDGTYLAMAHSASPYFSVYRRSGTNFTRLDTPAGTLGGASVSWNGDGTLLAVGGSAPGGVELYQRTGDEFALAATIPHATDAVAFSNDDAFLAIGSPSGIDADSYAYKVIQ